MKIYVFDIDGTICTNTYGDYESAKPYKERIDSIVILVLNQMYGTRKSHPKIDEKYGKVFQKIKLELS